MFSRRVLGTPIMTKRLLLAVLLALAPITAWASPGAMSSVPAGEFHPVSVALDCRNAAIRAERETGGRVLSARPDGSGACEVTLLVPNENSRPRRVVLVLPA